MEERNERIAAELQGIGKVYEGVNYLCEAEYDLMWITEYNHLARANEPVEGLGRIEGTVIAIGEVELSVRQKLTLEFEDGARLNFFVTDMNGTFAHSGG